MAFADGRLHVVDERNRRYAVLSPNLEILRQAPLKGLRPLTLGIVITSSGRTILNGIAHGAGFHRPVLHEIDTLGVRTASFDSVNMDRERERGFPNAERRIVAPSRDDRIWATREDDYDLSLWQLDPPQRVLRLTPRSNWFVQAPASSGPPAPGTPESSVWKAPPPAAILSLQEDSAGLLWVIGRTTNKDWKRYNDGRKGRSLKMYSGVVDVIDPSTGAHIIASVRLPFIGRFVGPQIIGSYQESADGYPTVALYRMRLRGYTQKPTRRN